VDVAILILLLGVVLLKANILKQELDKSEVEEVRVVVDELLVVND